MVIHGEMLRRHAGMRTTCYEHGVGCKTKLLSASDLQPDPLF
jgi:hypothetical protein